MNELEGLPIMELIDRFPRVPVKVPPHSKETLMQSDSSSSSLNLSSRKESVTKEENETDLSIERDYEDLMKRAIRGVISSKEQAALFHHLLTLNHNELIAIHNKVHDAMTLKNPMLKSKGPNLSTIMGLDKGFPMIDVSRYTLDFGGVTCQINVEVTDKMSISAKSGKVKYNFIIPTKDPRYDLRIFPTSGKLKNGKPAKEDVLFSIVCKTTVHARCVVILEIEGGYRYFFTVNVKSEPSLFGVSIQEMKTKEDTIFPGYTYNIPDVLVDLRHYLMEKKGLEEEGVFRVAGDEAETVSVKNKLNKGVFKETIDVHSISTLIKVFFRELPQPILNDLPPNVIISCEEEGKCMEEFEKYIKEPNKSVAYWLMDLMVQTALFEEKNKMSTRSLSIVIGPNLYFTPESSQFSGLESLRLSQQIVTFVFHLLNNRFKLHKK